MPEHIDFSVRKAIKASRDIKEQSRTDNVELSGNPGKNITQIERQVSLELSQIISENKEWIDAQKRKLDNFLSGVDKQEISTTYEIGLMLFFKQQYRLFTQGQEMRKRKMPEILKDPEYIRQQITAYTFDFIQLIKSTRNTGMPPKEVLELAKLSFHHNPDVFRRIESNPKYKDVPKWVVRRFVISYPSKPEEFIDAFIVKVEELKKAYPFVNPHVIAIAVSKHTASPDGPKKFIDFYINKKKELQLLYPDISESVISDAIVNRPKDPTSLIGEYKNVKARDFGVTGDEEKE